MITIVRIYTYISVKGCDSLQGNGTSLNETSTRIGTVVEVMCHDGYRMEGQSVVTCYESGNWSQYTRCVYIGMYLDHIHQYSMPFICRHIQFILAHCYVYVNKYIE